MASRMLPIAIVYIYFHMSITTQALNTKEFPESFIFGVASSAYQIEGAWNESGKGESVWDHFTHHNPDGISDRSNGDIACDSYHKIKEDVALIKDLGVNFYRFSISWTRLLPTGYSYSVNPDGIRYYNELINELVANDIKPMVTIYHWDLPQNLQKIGGWTNSLLADIFEDYARVAFENFGDRVPYWITINSDCDGYGGQDAPPSVKQSGIGEYLCAHTQLKAHAKVYHLYDREFRSKQKGQIGITVDPHWYEPKTNSKEDLEAAERARQFSIGWLAHPIFHKEGDYPQVVKDRVSYRSEMEGFHRSRLPEFTPDEVNDIKGAYDFLGMNIYTAYMASDVSEGSFDSSSYGKDVRAKISQDPSWPGSNAKWLKIVPGSVRNLLNWLKTNYNNPPIIVTENGYSDKGDLDDFDRINYYKLYLSSILDAIHEDQVNVVGYVAWSLLDNFEWLDGYTQKFGLYHVDFNDPGRKRTAKKSVEMYRDLISQRKLPVTEKDEL